MKRFYKDVAVEGTSLGFQVALDGRSIKTQGGQPQVVASRELAEKLAEEWRSQGEIIDPSGFRFRDMVDYALDVVPQDREALFDKLLGYAETDTLCYRAGPDEPLWHRQREMWEPLVEELEAREGIQFHRISGIIHRPQSAETRRRLHARLAQLDDFTLAALEQLTSLTASLCVGLAALEEDADGDALWSAANLEEDWQVEQWGTDEEASARRAIKREEFLAAMEFARTVK